MYCNNSNDYNKNSIPKTQKAKIAALTPSDDKDFMVRKIKIEASGSMPNHTNIIQHQQYVLEGEAKVVVGGDTYHAKKVILSISLLELLTIMRPVTVKSMSFCV